MIGELGQLAQDWVVAGEWEPPFFLFGGGNEVWGEGGVGGTLIVIPSAVHVGQLLKARAPVVEVVVVLVAGAGGVERADRTGGGAAALVVEHQQRVVRWSRGVIIRRPQALPERAPQGGLALKRQCTIGVPAGCSHRRTRQFLTAAFKIW